MAIDESVVNIHLGKLISALDKIVQNKGTILKNSDEKKMFHYLISVHKKPLNSAETKQIASAWTQRSKELHSAADLELSSAISTFAAKITIFTKDNEYFEYYTSQCNKNPQLKKLLERAASDGTSQRPSTTNQPQRPAPAPRPTQPPRPVQAPRPSQPQSPVQPQRPTQPDSPTTNTFTTVTTQKRKWWRTIMWIIVIGFAVKVAFGLVRSCDGNSAESADISHITCQEIFQTDNYEEQINVLLDARKDASRGEKKLIDKKIEEINSLRYNKIMAELDKSFKDNGASIVTYAKYDAIDGLQFIDQRLKQAESIAKGDHKVAEYREQFDNILKQYNINL